jgi:hypothetical protein
VERIGVAWSESDDQSGEGHGKVCTESGCRGEQVSAGKKSVTMRLLFRDPSRTLRHEEVDPQMATIVGNLEKRVGAGVRS